MRVVIDALQAGNRSGTGRYVEELIPALAALDADLELHVVGPGTAPGTGTSDPALRGGDVPVPNTLVAAGLLTEPPDRSKVSSWGSGTGTSRRPACASPRFLKVYAMHVTLPRLARRYRADLVHFTANVGALPMPRNAVLTMHDLSFLHHPEWFSVSRAWYYRAAAPYAARRARRVIAVSQHTADELQQWLGLPADRIDVVHNGLSRVFRPASEEARAIARTTYGLPERFFLYVGTLEPRKNVPRIIEAWSAIAKDTDCDLVIAGREGWKTGPVSDAAARSPHRERVRLPGYVADEHLPALLSTATAFVWPSLFEGFGWPPLEAMACGAPVITSSTSSLPEIVGDAAITVTPDDVGALADAMRQIAADAVLRDTLREKGLARAALFSWERAAQETVAAYERAIA